jgi:hypothetical protein
MTRASRLLRIAAPALLALAGCATDVVPVKELSAQQIQQLPPAGEISLSAANFATQALASVTTGPNGSATDVSRAGATASAAYAGAAKTGTGAATTPAPVAAGPLPQGVIFDFKKTADSAQSWATMTAAGMPFLFTQAFGQAGAAGTASWRARIQMPASGTNLYAQFVLPKADIQGFDEVQGPSQWQARLRVEVQMNGHPVWSNESTRVSLLDGPAPGGENCGSVGPKGPFLSSFGRDIGFDANPVHSSAAQTVTLNLGPYPAGQWVDVTMIVRTDAQVLGPCCPHDAEQKPELFCTRASAEVSWDPTAQPVRFWAGPNL